MYLYTQVLYTVCVCDFDSLVKLGEDDEMLPNSQSNQVILGLATSHEGEISVQANL